MQTFDKNGVTYVIHSDHFTINGERHEIPASIQRNSNRTVIRDGRLFINGFEFRPKYGGFDPYEKIKFAIGCALVLVIVALAIYLNS